MSENSENPDHGAPNGDGEPDERGENEHGERVEHEIHSLRAVFRERRIALETMDRPLRLATAGALASLLGVCLLIALRDVHTSSVVVGRTSGIVTEVPMPLFIATLVLLCAGFGYLLTGVTLATWWVALGGLVLITAAVGVETGSFGHVYGAVSFLGMLPRWAQWLSRTLLAAVWVTAGVARLFDRRSAARAALSDGSADHSARSAKRLRLLVLAVYTALFGAWFGILATASPHLGGYNPYGQIVDLLMTDIVLLVFPVLQVAAVDFGEWGGLTGERLAAATARPGLARVGLLVLAAGSSVALAVFGYLNLTPRTALFSGARLGRAGTSLLLLAVGVAVVVLAGRATGVHRRTWPATLSFASIFAVTAFLSYFAGPVAGLFSHAYNNVGKPAEQVTEDGRFTGAADVVTGTGGSGPTAFSMLIPRGWLPNRAGQIAVWTNYAYPGAKPGAADTPMVRVAVTTIPATFSSLDSFLKLPGAMPGTGREDDGWFVAQIKNPKVTVNAWVRGDPQSLTTSYLLYSFVRNVPDEMAKPQIEAIAHSFRTAGQPPAVLPKLEEAPDTSAERTADRIQLLVVLASALLVAALLAGYVAAGRRWPARVVGTVFLLGTITLATALFFGNALGRAVAGEHSHWPYLSLYGLLTTTGLGGLALSAFAAMHRDRARARTLLVAVVSFVATVWALEGMSVLYDHALRASRVSVWAAIIVLVAVGWDVTMSGESMTNHGTARAPRETRVLAFLGYVLLLAATVLFYSAQRAITTSAATEAYFEPEAVTRDALFRIAFPVAVLLFALRLAQRRRAAPVTGPDRDEPAPSTEEDAGR